MDVHQDVRKLWDLQDKSGAILGVIYYSVCVEKYSRLMVEATGVYF